METSARIDSSTPPLERLENSPVFLSDSFGNQLQSFQSNNQIQIVGNIVNNQNFVQKFVYIFQVKNSDNTIESISWISGEISAGKNLDVSQSWNPKKSGTYDVETFVWSSLTDPLTLSLPTSTSILVE